MKVRKQGNGVDVGSKFGRLINYGTLHSRLSRWPLERAMEEDHGGSALRSENLGDDIIDI
jgi:hypothetical protein